METKTLQALFLHELQYLYDAERQRMQTLPKRLAPGRKMGQ